VTTVGLISLGCPRNLVDSEVMLGLLRKHGFKVSQDITDCDAAIVNTCSFIEDAKKESIAIILQLIDLKKEKKIKAIVVTGCLPQRYSKELRSELKEIDAFLGTADFVKTPEVIKKVLSGKAHTGVISQPTFLYDHTYKRDLITPKHFVYIKLSEGCDNNCSYCIIPKIRGRLRSRSSESILKEFKSLTEKNEISELSLIGQDITLFGVDCDGKPKLAELLKKLTGLNKVRWIRLLYTHPEHYTDELIEVIKTEPSICKYLDLPLQHITDRMLKLMNRHTDRGSMVGLIKRLRKEIPNLALRTTFIVGFPGETDKEFKELYAFVREMEFERLGVFEYSREEGTPAYDFKDQVPDKIKAERFTQIMQLQQEVATEVNKKFMGRELDVLIDEVEEQQYVGRTEYDAPEVDGNCFVTSKKKHKPGDFIKTKITDTLEYDLVGKEI